MCKTELRNVDKLIMGVLFLAVPFFCLAKTPNHIWSDTAIVSQLLAKSTEKFDLEAYDSSLVYAQLAMTQATKLEAWDRWYQGFENIAYCHYYQDNYTGLVKDGTRYVKELMKHDGDSTYLAKVYGWIGFAYYFLEDTDKELTSYLQGIRILESIGKKEKGARLYQNVGIIYTKRADYDKAISYLEIAERYSIAQNEPDDLPTIWENMAYAYQAMKEYVKCIEICHKIIEANGMDFWTALIFAESYRGLADYDQSKYYLSICQKYLNEDQEHVFYYFTEKARLATETDKPNAINYFLKAIESGQELYTTNSRELAKIYINLGSEYLYRKEYDLAKVNYINGLSQLDSTFALHDLELDEVYTNIALSNGAWVMEAFYGLANAEKAMLAEEFTQARLDTAMAYYANTFYAIEHLRLNYQTEASQLHMTEYVNQIFENGLNFIFENLDKHDNDYFYDVIIYILEKSRSFVLSSSLRDVQAKTISNIPDSLLQLEKTLIKSIADLQNKMVTSTDSLDEEVLFTHQRQLEGLNLYFRDSFPRYARVKFQPKILTAAQIRTELLTDEGAIIYYLWGSEHLFSFVLTNTTMKLFRQDVKTLSRLLVKYLETMHDTAFDHRPQAYFDQFTELSFALYQKLLAESIALFDDSIEEITLLPDGNLHLLSFESLIRSKPGGFVDYALENMDYVIEKYACSYANSVDLLYRQKSSNKHAFTQEFAGFAPSFQGISEDIAYRKCGNQVLSDLRYNKEEVRTISMVTGGSNHFDDAASVAMFREKAMTSSVVHLATHACANATDINQNRIYFSNLEYLSNNDIYQMDIRSDMIVLSACETGLGKLATGEGVMSLARSFTFTGVPAILMSLWSIPDQSTSTIMSNFYARLKDGHSKNKALQLAKLDFIREASALQQHPHYWSATVVIGDTKTITFGRSPFAYAYWYMAGIIGILLLYFLIRRHNSSL